MYHKLAGIGASLAIVLASVALGFAGTAAADVTYQVQDPNAVGGQVYSGPHTSDNLVNQLGDGTAVDIVCQTYGEVLTDPVTGASSDVWDLLGGDQSGYISDLYVNTPGVGTETLTPCAYGNSAPPTTSTPAPSSGGSSSNDTPATSTPSTSSGGSSSNDTNPFIQGLQSAFNFLFPNLNPTPAN
jgi:hypothetical protein